MGFLDFFSRDKIKSRRLERAIRRANNRYTPKEYRQVALQDVIAAGRSGNETAIRGMIARFSVFADPSIEDEQEKQWVCDALIEIGRTVLPQIRKAMRTADSVTWLHRVLKGIVPMEEYKNELLSVLAEMDNEYSRNPDPKIQTIMALAEVPDHAVAESLIRFLGDTDETVRFQTVLALAKQADEVAREPLLRTLCEDESIRVKNVAVESFADLGWTTTGFKKKIDQFLPPGFRHDKTGKIVRLGQT